MIERVLPAAPPPRSVVAQPVSPGYVKWSSRWPRSPPFAWRQTLKRRLARRRARAGRVVGGHRGAARLSAGRPPRRSDAPAPSASSRARSRRTAKRGDILDRDGRVLAYSVDADSIYAVPTEISDPDAAAQALCGALEDCGPRERAAHRRSDPPRPRLRLRAPPGVARPGAPRGGARARRHRVHEGEPPLLSQQGSRRARARLRRHRQHRTERASKPSYDALIKGRPGTVLIQTDARRHAFSRIERPPTTGATLELTIDQYLQHVAERELRAGVEENRAAGGTAVVMDPRNGEILALANWPTLQPERLPRFAARGAAQSRDPGPLRAGLDVQDRHGVGGVRGKSRRPGRPDRRQRRQHPLRRARHRRRPQLRRAVVHRRASSSRATSARSRSGCKLGPERLGLYMTALRLRPPHRRPIFPARAPASCGIPPS